MNTFQVTLDNCAQEPIHIPNRIQPNGFLLVVRISDKSIIQLSENTADHLGLEVDNILGKPLNKVLNNIFIRVKKHFVPNASSFFDPVRAVINNKKYVCVPHITQRNILILEFEYERREHFLKRNEFLQQLNLNVLNVQQINTSPHLVAVAAKAIRQLTGYDRVMIYKFDQDYNGDVIAEEKTNGLYSFLHHRFPASDIPKQARELYLKNWVRVINDVNYVPVDLYPALNAVTNQFVDLSKAFLRSVSPVHIEYLNNMQVKATLTISIVVEGKLWGLIACHHYEPKYLGYDQRMGIEFLGKVLSHKWHIIEAEEVKNYRNKALAVGARIMSAIRFSNNLNETLTLFADDMLNITHSEGMVIAYHDSYFAVGKVPEKDFCAGLINWLTAAYGYNTFSTNELNRHYQAAGFVQHIASGILTVGFDSLSSYRIIWFKGEFTQSVHWGGNPNEKVLIMLDNEKYRLSPRKSFDKWTEAIKNRSKDWEEHHIEAANIFKSNFAEILAWRNSVYKQQKDLLEIEVNAKTEEITELYQQLLAQYKKLEAIAFEQSHTVRAPLATMMGLINLLEIEKDEQEAKQMYAMLRLKANELDNIIKEIINKL